MMKRFILALASLVMVISAVAVSGVNDARPLGELQIERGERNPWNTLKLNNESSDFQFAFVSDRTGGHRAGIFSRAVEQLNLLQPEFVVSVGDLIEGGSADSSQGQWKEFEGFVSRLQMPFFYVPGNHDIGNPSQDALWQEKFGRRYYHFVYRQVLFLLMNSEDPPGIGGGHFSNEQIEYFRKVLEDNRQVRWTIVVMHKPVWADGSVERTNWLAMEELLANRPYTVFAGHRHRYQKYVRQGRNYYQLATTGGASKIRGLRYGEFDHVVWVTMKDDGPVLANILVEGILPEDLKLPETNEPGSPRKQVALQAVRGKVLLDGDPLVDAHVVFHDQRADVQTRVKLDAYTEVDGTFILTTYSRHDGAPAGDYVVTIELRKPDPDNPAKLGPNVLPALYSKPETSDLKVSIREGSNELRFDLRK